jgi:hypothetical protein
MRRSRACVGLIVVCAAGAVLGGAGGLRGLVLWGSGGSGLLLGVLLVLSSLRAPRPRPRTGASAAAPPPQQWVDWQQTAVPRIGTILIDKYGFITPGELERALEVQKGSSQRLGEILVGMGVLSPRDLEMALDYQRSLQRRSWRQTDVTPPPGRSPNLRARRPAH